MTKDEVQKIQFDIEADGQSELSLMLCRDGTIGRQGNGNLPAEKTSVLGLTDGNEFATFINLFDDRVFAHQGVFDHPDKRGMPINYSVAFLGAKPNVCRFEFRLGLENKDVGDLLPYFDDLIKKAVALTDAWHSKATAEKEAGLPAKTLDQPPSKKPWWKIW